MGKMPKKYISYFKVGTYFIVIFLSVFLLSVFFIFGNKKTLKNATKCKHSKNSFCCVEYVKNYDGDTITVNINGVHFLFGTSINVRVAGIDTPELRTKNKCEKEKAIIARDLVKDLLVNASRIDLVNTGRGKYFRIVADVIIDGKLNLKDTLLQKGLAYEYDGGRKQKINWCKQ